MRTKRFAGDQGRHDRYLEISHDFLFSLNIALLVRLVNAQTSLSTLEPDFTFRINAALGLNPHMYFGGYIAFFVLALGLASALYVLLWILASFVSTFFRSSYGFVSMTALPLTWLASTTIHQVLPGLPNPPRAWLLLELVAVVICSVLFLVRRWPLPDWASVALLAMHFVFWGWLFMGGIYFWLAPTKLVFPLVGFCSCIAWGIGDVNSDGYDGETKGWLGKTLKYHGDGKYELRAHVGVGDINLEGK